MNKQRRKELEKLKDQLMDLQTSLEEIKDEEQECYDNLPEGIQCSDRGEEMANNVEQLQECSDALETAIGSIEELI